MDRKLVDDSYEKSVTEKKGGYELVYRIIRKSTKEERVVMEKCNHKKNDNGDVTGSQGMILDVTELEKAKAKIRDMARFPMENPYPVFRINLDGMITETNKKCAEQVKWCQKDVKAPEKWVKLVETAIKKGEISVAEEKHGERHLSFSIVPVVEGGYANIYATDVTQLKKALREREKIISTVQNVSHKTRIYALEQEAIFKTVAEPMIVYGVDGKIIKYNQAAEKSLGIKPGGKTISLLLESMDARDEEGRKISANTPAVLESLAGKTIKNRKLFFRDNDGVEKTILVSAAPIIMNESIRGAVVQWHDITEYERLEDTRKSLLRDLSHQLKTPLAVIEMAANTLQDDLSDFDRQEVQSLEMITRNTGGLKKLVSKILQLGRIESGDVQVREKRFSLSKLARETSDSIRLLAQEKGLKITVKAPKRLMVKTDRDKISQALQNILENAVKYTEKGGIYIRVTPREKTAEITVRDTGAGMTKKQCKQAFKRFYKADPSVPGTGFGLNIAKQNMRLIGGEILAESPGKGEGSVFKLIIPR